jgi:hypothetical protein
MLENYHNSGGSIVLYRRVVSLIFFAQSSPSIEWVPPRGSRGAIGRKHALWCLLLGVWSPLGLFAACGAIIHNVMGGVDVTKELTGQQFVSSHVETDVGHRELKAIEHVQRISLATFVTILLVVLAYFFIIPRFIAILTDTRPTYFPN